MSRVVLVILVVFGLVFGAAWVRVGQAREYMEGQTRRLLEEGKGRYEVSGVQLFSLYTELGTRKTWPVITVRAREPGKDGYAIAIDFPWFPWWGRPTHRI